MWASNLTSGRTHQGNQNWKRHTHPSIHCSTFYNSLDMEETEISIRRGMDKEVVVHIHNGIFSSVQSLSRVRLFVSPWIAACQGSLSITNSRSLLKQTGEILMDMGMPGHLTCLLRSLYAGQEATVRTVYRTVGWFQIEKGACQGCILLACLFNSYAEYSMQNASCMKHRLKSRLPGEISITSDMQMTPHLWQNVKRN